MLPTFTPIHVHCSTRLWWSRKVLLWITIFMLLLVNNVVQKMRTQVTNTISLYKSCYIKFIFIFRKIFLECLKLKTTLKQINNKKTLVSLYEDIVFLTRVRIFCTTLFTNINTKIVIKSSNFLDHPGFRIRQIMKFWS